MNAELHFFPLFRFGAFYTAHPALLLSQHPAVGNPLPLSLLALAPRAEILADMEPNTSRSSAAGTSHAAIVDHGSSSTNAQSHLSPTSFLTQPSPRLSSASHSRSQSPGIGGGRGSLSDHGHATLLAGQQPWQGLAPPPMWIASGIPLWSSSGEGIFLGFTFTCLTSLLEKIMAWVWRGEMSLATSGREPELADEEEDDAINVSGRISRVARSSSSLLTLSIGPNKSSTLSLRAGAGSSNVRGLIFTEAEKEIVKKDKNLQKLIKTDPKKVKR